jgi:DNA polymerase-1
VDEIKFKLPNIRKLFVPDPGFTFFDGDLDRADLQVVVWEADDAELKAAMKMGVDMHLLNAYTLAGKNLPPLEELNETHPRYQDHRIPYKKERQLAKSFIHGTNYGGGARTMALAANITVHQADKFQKLYFDKYPGLRKWHERTEVQLKAHRFVENKFGYRRYYFDRVDGLLPEALAWIPQSTVAIYINHIWLNIFNNVKEVQTLLQVHDSIAGQFPTHLADWCLKKMKEEASKIIIPYSDPLVIPFGIKTSTKSWGDCE